MEFLRDLWKYLKERKKWWLLPVIVILLLFGILIILSSGSAIAPFIYTLFWSWKMDKAKTLESMLVLTAAFLLLYFITTSDLFLYIAFALAITGIFIKPLARYIALTWFKLAGILNYVVSGLVLGTIFFVVLFPVSLLYRISNRDKLQLKKKNRSLWIERNQKYLPENLKDIWWIPVSIQGCISSLLKLNLSTAVFQSTFRYYGGALISTKVFP